MYSTNESGQQVWGADTGIVISGSASTREEAVEVAKSLSVKSEWLSENNTFFAQ